MLNAASCIPQWQRSPGKVGSHYDPNSDLFVPGESNDVLTSSACWFAMLGFLGGLTVAFGPVAMFKLYLMPYWVSLMYTRAVLNIMHSF